MAALAALPAIFASAAPAAATAATASQAASALSVISTVASAAGTAVSAIGTIASGEAKARHGAAMQRAAEFEAKQHEVRAKEEQALAQREALQLRRQKKLALSQLQARSAFSGSATDPSTLALAEEIEKYGTTQEQLAMYGGASRAEQERLTAAGRRFEGVQEAAAGREALQLSRLGAVGTILGGVSTLAERFGTKKKPRESGLYGLTTATSW